MGSKATAPLKHRLMFLSPAFIFRANYHWKLWMGWARRKNTVNCFCRLSIAKGYFRSIYAISSDFRHSFQRKPTLWHSVGRQLNFVVRKFRVISKLAPKRWGNMQCMYQFQILIEHFPPSWNQKRLNYSSNSRQPYNHYIHLRRMRP